LAKNKCNKTQKLTGWIPSEKGIDVDCCQICYSMHSALEDSFNKNE
jgi:hypothetical protein